MRKARAKNTSTKNGKRFVSSVTVRLAPANKAMIAKAANLRQISVSDYIRTVAVAQARNELTAAKAQTILLSPEEQLAFWTSLCHPTKLTASQKALGRLMRRGS